MWAHHKCSQCALCDINHFNGISNFTMSCDAAGGRFVLENPISIHFGNFENFITHFAVSFNIMMCTICLVKVSKFQC